MVIEMGASKRDSGSGTDDVAHEAVRRTMKVEGVVTPAFIHNGPTYFLIRLPVYADGLVDAWELVDQPLFEEKLRSGWVTPSAPDGEEVSVHGLGAWTITHGTWSLSPNGLADRVKGLVRQLNPEMRNLYNCHGQTTKTVKGVRISILGMPKARPVRAADDSPLPRQFTGDCVFVLTRRGDQLFLSDLRVFEDGMVELGWVNDQTLMSREDLRTAVARGEVVAEPKVGERVTISSLGSFEVADVQWSADMEELLKEIDDVVDKLNGRPDAIARCRAAYEAYLASPTPGARDRLKAAYEMIPEHNQMYVGDMDTKDIPIRMIIYGEEEIEGWSHRAVARAQGMDLPTITVPKPQGNGETQPLALADLAGVLSDSNVENGRFHLCLEQPLTSDEAAAWRDRAGATALFLRAFAKIAVALSEPEDDDGGRGLQATWNIADHRWRLCLVDRSEDQAVVLLERSASGGGVER